jgi:voltage-gated potassium channel
VSSRKKLLQWEAKTEWPLAAVALAFLGLYSVQVLGHLHGAPERGIDRILLALYIIFVADYVVRLSLAENRLRWFFSHLLDLAAVALPFVRPLRVLRLVAVVEVLQRAIGGAIRGGVIMYSALSSTVLVYAASLAVLDAERSAPNAFIRNFGDAVWWAISTVTTVGYGEFYPVTVVGRTVAVLLMIGGISLIGTITATVASWIVERVAQDDSTRQNATVGHIEELRAEIAKLTKLVVEQQNIGDPAEAADRADLSN